MKPRARMSDAQWGAITTELVRVTLGGRPVRPELEHALPERQRPTRRKR